jgi:hypothetical protein
MSVTLSTVSLESARIVRVIEDVDSRRMAFDVSYPIPEGGSDFPQRRFIFHDCRRYLVEEERGIGEPVIQRVEISEIGPHLVTIRMHTDLGVRELTCSPSVLEDTP